MKKGWSFGFKVILSKLGIASIQFLIAKISISTFWKQKTIYFFLNKETTIVTQEF